jgi:hypothetical protein
MAKRPKKEEEIEDGEEVQSEEDAPKRKARKVSKAKVKAKAKAPEKEPKAIRRSDPRPLSVGGIIIRTKSEQAAWEKDAPWHRKSPAESRFRDYGTNRRAKD